MKGIPPAESAELNGLLATAAERGLPLAPAMDLLAGQARRASTRDALSRVAASLRDGAALPQALEAAPGIFPPDQRALIAAGVQGGRLPDLLRHAQAWDTLRAALRRHLLRLTAYVGSGALLCFLVFGLLLLLARKLADIFEALGMKELPPLTRGLLWISGNIVPIAIGLAIAGGLAFLFYRLARRLPWTARFLYWIPVLGRLQRSRDLATFCTIVALRLRANLPLPEALDAAAAATPNRHARRLIDEVRKRVAAGESLSSALFRRSFFPRSLCWAVSLGEERNDVPTPVDLFARIYSAELERNFETLTVMLTPVSILLLGNLVILTVVAVFAPIMQVQRSLGGF